MQNYLQFDTITVILNKRVKSQGVSEEKNDFKMFKMSMQSC